MINAALVSEMYRRVCVGKNLSDMFSNTYDLKGDALSPLPFNIALRVEYAITRVLVNQDGLKLNGSHQLLVYAEFNILEGSVHTV